MGKSSLGEATKIATAKFSQGFFASQRAPCKEAQDVLIDPAGKKKKNQPNSATEAKKIYFETSRPQKFRTFLDI